jgi:hypothetical protein
MPYKPGLGQGHNQKKDTHTLDFDVTLPIACSRLHAGIGSGSLKKVSGTLNGHDFSCYGLPVLTSHLI